VLKVKQRLYNNKMDMGINVRRNVGYHPMNLHTFNPNLQNMTFFYQKVT